MTGAQIKALRNALSEAFNFDTLRQMLRTELERNLDSLAGPGDLQTVVFTLIQVAERNGWTAKLIRGASRANPDNPALKQFRQDYPELTSADMIGNVPPHAKPPEVVPVLAVVDEPQTPRVTEPPPPPPPNRWKLYIIIGVSVLAVGGLLTYLEQHTSPSGGEQHTSSSDGDYPSSISGWTTIGEENMVLNGAGGKMSVFDREVYTGLQVFVHIPKERVVSSERWVDGYGNPGLVVTVRPP